MTQHDTVQLLKRLLAVTIAARDEFLRAARLVRSPAFAAHFVVNAEDLGRIGLYLLQQLAPGAPEPSSEAPNGAFNYIDGYSSKVDDPAELLDDCVAALDTTILAFSRAYGPAITLSQRIQLARHQNQLEWAREELQHLRAECRNGRATKKLVVADQPVFGQRSFDAAGYGVPHEHVGAHPTDVAR